MSRPLFRGLSGGGRITSLNAHDAFDGDLKPKEYNGNGFGYDLSSPMGPGRTKHSLTLAFLKLGLAIIILAALSGSFYWTVSMSSASQVVIHRGYRRLQEQLVADLADVGELSLGTAKSKDLEFCPPEYESYVPCYYNVSESLESVEHSDVPVEYERQCVRGPEKEPACLVLPPKNYRIPLRWPFNRSDRSAPIAERMYGFEALTFNIHGGYLEAIVRGYRAGLLTAADYNNLCQCETLDDIKMHLSATEYAPYLQNEPSPLHTTTIVEKCTLKLVDEYKHMLCQATEPLSTFLEYITYGHMIDNVVLIVTGTLHERDVQELLEKCHPLGMFDSIATLAVAQNMRELYRLVLVDTPLAPYFSECITSEKLGGATAEIMSDLLAFEADRRAVNITINSIGTELTRDDRRKLYSSFGLLYPYGHEELAVCEDIDQVRGVMEKYPPYQSIFAKLSYGESQMLDKAFYEEEVKRLCLAFEQQFHYAVFFAYMRLREQEIRNLMWISECVAQNQKSRVHDSVVFIF